MQTNPEIDATLNELTNLCCDALSADAKLNSDRLKALTRNLAIGGWERHSSDSAPLSTILKKRIRKQCREPAIHRGAKIDGIVKEVQSAYNDQRHLKTSTPGDNNPSQPMPPRTTA